MPRPRPWDPKPACFATPADVDGSPRTLRPLAAGVAARRALQQARLVNGAATCTNANTATPFVPTLPTQGTADARIRDRECLPASAASLARPSCS